jgi:hypothetical protein
MWPEVQSYFAPQGTVYCTLGHSICDIQKGRKNSNVQINIPKILKTFFGLLLSSWEKKTVIWKNKHIYLERYSKALSPAIHLSKILHDKNIKYNFGKGSWKEIWKYYNIFISVLLMFCVCGHTNTELFSTFLVIFIKLTIGYPLITDTMTTTNKKKQKIKAQSYPCNRLWKPKGL